MKSSEAILLSEILNHLSATITDEDIQLAKAAAQAVSRQYDDEDGGNTIHVLTVRLNMTLHKAFEEQY